MIIYLQIVLSVISILEYGGLENILLLTLFYSINKY